MAGPERFEQQRLKKLERIIELGHDPFGGRFDGHIAIAKARELAPEKSGVDGQKVRVAGRIMLRRKAGKLRFYDIQDATGRIQLLFSRGDLSDEQWELMGQLDLGDLIGVDGPLRRTETAEISVLVKKLTVLCKSLVQPPEKFHGARDIEMLLRQRYIDLIYNGGVLQRMLERTRIIESVRKTLAEHGFVEVETPVLHAIAGGAAARPFTTHHNALDIELYLRIALELHLKRLMVGGIERVYEIGRVFRNEGIDATHNPEFTMLEAYQAYGNYETMMDLSEAIVVNAVRAVLAGRRCEPAGDAQATASGETGDRSQESGVRRQSSETPGGSQDAAEGGERLVLPWDGGEIDFTPPWPRYRYSDLLWKYAHVAIDDPDTIRARARDLAATGKITSEFAERMATTDMHPDVIVNELFEATVEEHLHDPVFVMDYPASLCPLTRRKPDDPTIAERFEPYIAGMEIGNAYTELNDPRLQEELFQTQLAGLPEEESMAKMDRDFIRALKVGMPPAGGLGIGIDRLVMLLTDTRSIRDVIFFPLLRPEQGEPAENVDN